MDETTGKIYEQASENWRFLAKWRQLAFAGYLAVIAGGMSFINSATEHGYPHRVIGCCFLFLAWIGFIFWIADRRTHQLTMHACKAGVALEGTKRGFFRVNSKLDKKASINHFDFLRWKDSHSRAALLLFWGSILVFGLAAGKYIRTPLASETGGINAVWDYTVVREVSASNTSSSLEKDLNRAGEDGWEFLATGNDSGGRAFVILRRHRR